MRTRIISNLLCSFAAFVLGAGLIGTPSVCCAQDESAQTSETLIPVPKPVDIAGFPHFLIDRQLNSQHVKLISMTGDTVTTRLPTGELRNYPIKDILVIVNDVRRVAPKDGSMGLESAASVRLCDGQFLQGALAISRQPLPDTFAFDSLSMGTVQIPIESVDLLSLTSTPIAPDPAQWDHLLLRNGDRLLGFVEAIGTSLSFTPENSSSPATPSTPSPPSTPSALSTPPEPANDNAAPAAATDTVQGPAELPLTSILGIDFANPSNVNAGNVVYLEQEVVQFDRLTLDASLAASIVLVSPQAQPRPYQCDFGSIRAIIFDAATVTPLSALGPPDITTPQSRRWVPPPVSITSLVPAWCPPVEISGPAQFSWTLPSSAKAIAGRIRLPDRCRTWGDMKVVVELVPGGKLLEARIHAGNPTAAFRSSASTGARLTVSIDSGVSGPIQDSLSLEDVIVLHGK